MHLISELNYVHLANLKALLCLHHFTREKHLSIKSLTVRMTYISSFTFINDFIQVRIAVDLEPIPGKQRDN